MLSLRNCLPTLLRATSPLPFSAWRLLSISPSPSPALFDLEGYLVTSCGLAPAQAREVSKKASRHASYKGSTRPLEELSYSRLNSASNPDAILALLAGAGLSREGIAAVVSADPLILRASVKNIAPRLAALRDRLGLSTLEITRFLMVGSRALRDCDVVPRLEFFISFYGSFEQVLVVLKRNMTILTVSPERVTKPNIALFRQWGVGDFVKLCSNNPWLLSFKPERLKEVLLRAEELGVPPTSRRFRHAVKTVSRISKDTFASKLEFYKRTLGVSESEVSTAVSKMPTILGFSNKLLLRKIKFLLNEAGMEPRHIVERPVLFSLSLEKRKVLQDKGLLNSDMNLSKLVLYGEEAFKSKFIDRHKYSAPGLADVGLCWA